MAGLLILAACCTAVGGCDGRPRSHHWHVRPAVSPVRFVAVDRSGAAKLTLVETRIPPTLTFARFSRNEPRMIRSALRPRSLRAQREGRALRVDYAVGSAVVHQSFFLDRARMYVVTYTLRSR